MPTLTTTEGDQRLFFGQGRPMGRSAALCGGGQSAGEGARATRSGNGANWYQGTISNPAGGGSNVESRFFFEGTVTATDMSRSTDAREASRIGIFGTSNSYGGSYGRVTNEALGRDLNPLGRGNGQALVAGMLNVGKIAPALPMAELEGGAEGNSVNNQCASCATSGTSTNSAEATLEACKKACWSEYYRLHNPFRLSACLKKCQEEYRKATTPKGPPRIHFEPRPPRQPFQPKPMVGDLDIAILGPGGEVIVPGNPIQYLNATPDIAILGPGGEVIVPGNPIQYLNATPDIAILGPGGEVIVPGNPIQYLGAQVESNNEPTKKPKNPPVKHWCDPNSMGKVCSGCLDCCYYGCTACPLGQPEDPTQQAKCRELCDGECENDGGDDGTDLENCLYGCTYCQSFLTVGWVC